MYGGAEKYTQNFKGSHHLGKLDVDGWITLK
jgi:hypothetical protein